MKKRIAVVLALTMALAHFAGCAGQGRQKYSTTYLDLFDTVTTISGYTGSEEEFAETARSIHDSLLEYHQLFDIYETYEGIHNLKTVNDNAGIAPVEVDERIIDFLLDCREYYELTDGRVNVAMGSVLYLWHEAREKGINEPENAKLPEDELLAEAARHCGFDTLIIDEEAGTVYISDPAQRLDVGAVAKGWAAQRAAEQAPGGLLISVGGNVCVTGPKDAAGTPWVVGIDDPDGGGYLHTISVTGDSVVTSGDYQRYYIVDGVAYHHIIDPVTLYPSEYWRSVTIVCEDSGLADALSTALFLLPLEEGQALLTQCGAEAMWINAEGEFFYSPGFETLIRT